MVTKDEARLRRARATGQFFKKTKVDKYRWTNHLYPLALIIALIFVLIV